LAGISLRHASLANANPGKGMKEPGNIQYPQNDGDDYDGVQD
jgi:hypothetical protein